MGLNPAGTQPFVVYGAGSAGKQLVRLLDELGLPVLACIDKHAPSIHEINGHPVWLPQRLATFRPEIPFDLIVAVNSRHAFESIRDELAADYPQLPSPIWGRALADRMASERCHRKLQNNKGIDLLECMGCRADPSHCTAFREAARKVAPQQPTEMGSSPGKLNDFAYFITNRCTLNCQHCVEALPYYEARQTESCERILKTVRRVVAASGYIDRFSLTGGETMLNRELPEIIHGILATPGIGFVYLYTSGTVVPSTELLRQLANPRIAVNLSDYGEHLSGKLKDNFERCRTLFDEHGIAYRLLENKLWFDLGTFAPMNLDAAALRKSFANCAFTHCISVSGGVMYRCPHQLAGIQLGRLSSPPGETVDIDHLDDHSLRKALDSLVELESIDACNHCLLTGGAHEVPAAIQVRRLTRRITPEAPPRDR